MGDGDFKSFGDLRRALGGGKGEQADEPREDGGWTLEADDEGPTAEDLGTVEELPDLAGSARARILARPSAFGAMALGPRAYRDEESEEMGLLRSFRVRTLFPADVRAEVAGLPEEPRTEDLAGRLDLRGRILFTIDGEDAQDFDDAISIEELEGGDLEVGVHIADVGHYVRPGTKLDDEALARATSIYLPDQVVPMLPEELSNGLCSLVPDRDRLAYSVLMVFDAQGTRKDVRIAKSVIRSCKRNTYAAVQDLLDGKRTPAAREIEHLEPALRLFERWTKRQQALRDARGSMRMQSRERKFVFDEEGEVAGIVDGPTYFSNALIEETALAANQAVGDLFRARGLPTIYRVHPEKDPEEIEAIVEMLGKFKIRVPKKARLTGRDVARLVLAARRRPNAEALIQRIMGLVERAEYEVKDHEDVARHFGLAREAYLHFTSPIRRYPDLVVHRWLFAVETRGDRAAEELRAGDLLSDLNDVARHCTLLSEMADMVSFAVADLKVCQYMHPHVGEKLEATILRVGPPGLTVLLPDFNVTGFLPTRLLGEKAKVEGPTMTVRAGRRNLSFSEGSPITVRLKDVDFLRLQLLLDLA